MALSYGSPIKPRSCEICSRRPGHRAHRRSFTSSAEAIAPRPLIDWSPFENKQRGKEKDWGLLANLRNHAREYQSCDQPRERKAPGRTNGECNRTMFSQVTAFLSLQQRATASPPERRAYPTTTTVIFCFLRVAVDSGEMPRVRILTPSWRWRTRVSWPGIRCGAPWLP